MRLQTYFTYSDLPYEYYEIQDISKGIYRKYRELKYMSKLFLYELFNRKSDTENHKKFIKRYNTVKLHGGWLASRKGVIQYREQIEELLKNSNGYVYVDLKNVECICGGCADEIFGVLVMKFGFENILNRIKLLNGSKRVVTNIAEAMNRRKLQAEKE